MERKLASIQRILDLQPIPDADKIEVATILGWQLVVKKGEFRVGDACVYVEVDGLLPEREEFEFLRARKFRIRTVRLRGQISQGICFPLSILPANVPHEEGRDVTADLGITKYEPPIPVELRGLIKGPFPSFLIKTDEMRIQSFPRLIDEIVGQPVYLAEKIDGTSSTFSHHDGEFDICGRNMSYKETEGNLYWRMFRQYQLADILAGAGNFAVQGEIAGPGIQKNRLNLKQHQLFIFNVFDIDRYRFLDFSELEEFCGRYQLPTVPIISSNEIFRWTLPELLELAKGNYISGKPREGIVVRPMREMQSKILGGRLSFKVINNDFLLKEEE